MTGLYVPGTSVLHETAAGLKLTLLLTLSVCLFLFDSVIALTVCLVIVGFAFVKGAELGATRLWATTKPLLIWFVLIGAMQALTVGSDAAIVIILRLTALVWCAALVTHTTRLTDMMDSLVNVCGWLRPVGVSPDRVAFVLALAIRLIPALGEIVAEVRDVQRARGLDGSVKAAVIPVVTRVLYQADTMSDALVARGYDRWDTET